jgi:hypothetical protein
MIDPIITKIIKEISEEFKIPESKITGYLKYFFNWQYNALNTVYAAAYLWPNFLTITLTNRRQSQKYFEAVDEYILNNRKKANKTPTKGWINKTTKNNGKTEKNIQKNNS